MSGPAGSELAYLARALKAPRVNAVSGRLAERAREEGWDYEAYLAAVLAEEVSARDSHGGSARVKAARFPAVKTLDDFDFTVQTSVSRPTIAHLGQLDFLAEAKNVVFLGPRGTGKTHLSIALGVPAWPAGRVGHRPPGGQPARGGEASGTARRQARTPRPDPAAHRRRGRLHPVRSGGRGALLRPDLVQVRAALADRELEQDVLPLGRDLRRPGGRRGHGRPGSFTTPRSSSSRATASGSGASARRY